MRSLWYATHAVVNNAESDPEFAKFVHESEERFKEMRFYREADDEPFEVIYRKADHPDWTIRIVTNWDRSRTTICFPGEEIEE